MKIDINSDLKNQILNNIKYLKDELKRLYIAITYPVEKDNTIKNNDMLLVEINGALNLLEKYNNDFNIIENAYNNINFDNENKTELTILILELEKKIILLKSSLDAFSNMILPNLLESIKKHEGDKE